MMTGSCPPGQDTLRRYSLARRIARQWFRPRSAAGETLQRVDTLSCQVDQEGQVGGCQTIVRPLDAEAHEEPVAHLDESTDIVRALPAVHVPDSALPIDDGQEQERPAVLRCRPDRRTIRAGLGWRPRPIRQLGQRGRCGRDLVLSPDGRIAVPARRPVRRAGAGRGEHRAGANPADLNRRVFGRGVGPLPDSDIVVGHPQHPREQIPVAPQLSHVLPPPRETQISCSASRLGPLTPPQ